MNFLPTNVDSDSQPTHVSISFQIIAFMMASCMLSLIIMHAIYRFQSYDPFPEITSYTHAQGTPDHRADVHTSFLTSSGTTKAARVRTGISIGSFSQADLMRNNFIVEAVLWFIFDPEQISVDDIAKFIIERGEIIERSPPKLTPYKGDDGNTRTLAQFPIRAKFKTAINYRAYPLDDHIVHLVFGYESVPAQNCILETSQNSATLAPDIRIPNCRIESIAAHAGYATRTLELPDGPLSVKNPRVIFSIECNRIDTRHFLNIFMPLLLIFFFTLFAFSFDFREHGTTVPSIAAAGVPALLAYRFVIETTSPDVSYFMLSDYLFFLFLTLVFMIFLFVAGALHSSRRTKQLIIVGLYALMIFGCALLLHVIC